MKLHNWTQYQFEMDMLLPGMPYVTNVQHHICRDCGTIVSLPDCKKKTCLALLSLGCSGEKPKVSWKAPIKTKGEYIEKKDYPKKKEKKRR